MNKPSQVIEDSLSPSYNQGMSESAAPVSEKRILICGDRNWTDERIIRRLLEHQPSGTVVIEGEGRGADRIAAKAATDLGLAVERYPAQWDQHGRRAGPIRNQQMLDEGRPTVVVGFHEDIATSKGTTHMLRIALGAGVPTYLFDADHVFKPLSLDLLKDLTQPLSSPGI